MNAARFSSVMRSLAKVPSRMSRVICQDLSKEVQKNFDRGLDPYGKEWEALRPSTIARGRHPPPLTDTGAGRASVTFRPTSGSGIRASIGIKYMVFHQRPKISKLRHFPQRMFIPEKDLPNAWGELILARYEEETRKVLNGG